MSNLQYVEEVAAMKSWDIQLHGAQVGSGFKDRMCAVKFDSIHAETSTVVYLSVLDIHADTIEAMSEVAAHAV
jgi:hypothetical protein